MSYLQELYQKMIMQGELDDMVRLDELKQEITYWAKRYHGCIKDKNIKAADVINKIIDALSQEMENGYRSIKNNSREVLPTQSAGDQRIFILER